ncbi:MAG: Ldh family oxidoreductase [Burkholderiaceae bacterium]
MTDTVSLTLAQATDLVTRALVASGARAEAAAITAAALVDADAQGLASHGLSRVPQYAAFLRNGRADGRAQPRIIAERASAVLIDAGNGLAFPACRLAIDEAVSRARQTGIALAAVTNSHHFGVAAGHLDPVARASMVGLALGNSPAAMPVPGGRRPLLGTNPLAACFPRQGHPPLVMDLSLSEVARGRIMVAARNGQPIPAGWALDAQGCPTTDAEAALKGSMLPLGSASGSAKGGMIALLIELLAVTLTGAHFGAEADSFFLDEGNQPRLGQVFIVIDPAATAGSATYNARIEALIGAMCEDDSVRLPGARRDALRRAARAEGLTVTGGLHTQIVALCKAAPTGAAK